MKSNIAISGLLLLLMVYLSSCQAIGDIFKAGVWSGILLVIAIIALIIFVVSKMSNRK